jgi:hypothetical protein
VRQRIEPAEQAVAALQDVEAALTVRCDAVCGEVTEHIGSLAASLQQRKEQLLAQCHALAEAKGKRLAAPREACRAAWGACRRAAPSRRAHCWTT